jgi:hypothetical protein
VRPRWYHKAYGELWRHLRSIRPIEAFALMGWLIAVLFAFGG